MVLNLIALAGLDVWTVTLRYSSWLQRRINDINHFIIQLMHTT